MPNIQFHLLLFFFFVTQLSWAQKTSPADDYFRPPMDIPMYLSGTFGELRSNHFHAGIDIKTQGVEGKSIYAIADGYVSRIKIATGGYGKAIYITHPNGYVSVYGHLKKFAGEIQEYVIEQQYLDESFAIQKFPEKDLLPVKKGQLIAYSGNTGGSQAPHLHFEIREEKTQFPVNPLSFKSIKVKDYFRPKISRFSIYPADEKAQINGKNDTLVYQVEGWGLEHRLKGKPIIEVSGNVSFGLSTHDLMNEISNQNGVYELTLQLDSAEVFSFIWDKISFGTTRYINSLIDYHYYKLNKKRLIRTQLDTNNRLFNYAYILNNGIVNFSDTSSHELLFVVKDIYANESRLPVHIQAVQADEKTAKSSRVLKDNESYFDFRKRNSFRSKEINLDFPANTFYRSFIFSYDESEAGVDMLSSIYHVHDRFIPVHKKFTMTIEASHISDSIRDKVYVAYVNEKGETAYVGGKWQQDKLVLHSRLLGSFSLMADSIPPIIKPVNLKAGTAVKYWIKVKIKDEQSGIKTYRAELNGEWVLMEYEPKKNLLFYEVDEHLKKGKNIFRLTVTDLLNNTSYYETEVSY